MNIDRGKESFSPEEISSIRQQLAEYKTAEGLSWTDLDKMIGGVAGTTLSAFANATYLGDNANVAWKVNRFFVAEEARRAQTLQMPVTPGFRMLPTSKMMTQQLRWAHQGEISIIVGNPGMSKTATMRQYVGVTPNAFMVTAAPAMRSVVPMLGELYRELGHRQRNFRTSNVLYQDVRARLMDLKAVVIVDEAQHLADATLDQLRAISDATGCGLVLAGNTSVLGRIQQGAQLVEFAQISSRVSWPQSYLQPLPEDIAILCEAWGVENAREREFLGKVALLPGALRSMTQVLKMATLSARATEEDRTLSHLKSAWTQLSRQTIAA